MSVELTCKRLRVRVKGIVQGVGFRPFVHQTAKKFSLSGFVLNDADGVIIEIEGSQKSVSSFLNDLTCKAPILSHIDCVDVKELKVNGEIGFAIRHSDRGSATTMVSPDIALCGRCQEEMKDPSNRRYRYPFINCTDCGPRYSIIKKLPYDRPDTSMHKFRMCEACEKEYENPNDRRYHAQPISCHACGPTLYLMDKNGENLAKSSEAITLTCKHLRDKKIVAIKGIGGFHLVCNATDEQAVSMLRERKRRPKKPLAVMFKDMEVLKKEADIHEKEQELLLSKERPIVIVHKNAVTSLAPSIAPNIDRVGVFLPYTPLHVLLLEELDFPIVATSANLSDEPIIIDEKEIFSKLGDIVDLVLTYDREIVNGCDDSVVMMADGQKLLTRLSRGYAPKSFLLPKKTKKRILAVGANQKNTLALAFDEHILLSPHIGDLGSLEAFEYFTRTLETFKRFYGFEPDIIVCDKHPEYETTKWAKAAVAQNSAVELIEVQHHYAHALSCMAEYGLDEKVLAFCFDGTGYGDDKTLWGGEVLVADALNYERVHYFSPFRLLGAQKAVKEPRRSALSLLFESLSLNEVLSLKSATVKSFTVEEIKSLHVMWQKGLNSPLTSSVGRLFDAVASLSSLIQKVSYEGESGLLVESAAQDVRMEDRFGYRLDGEKIEIKPMIKEILQTKDAGEIGSKFISTLVHIILDISKKYPSLPVVFCGGVFQNRTLVSELIKQFQSKKIRYYIQKDTPVNDGSIALGQVYHAFKRSEDER